MNTIKKIVLTGGPCAGKTTALVKIIDHFSGLGYKVFTIPEVPTMFTQAGMNYLTKNEKFFFEGEKATFLTQIGLEDSFTKMAETIDKPVIIVCDRGTMDISTYLTEDFWNRIISEQGYTNTQLRERYDAVLHLVSAADGAEQFYTTANNAQRVEKADEKGLQIAREQENRFRLEGTPTSESNQQPRGLQQQAEPCAQGNQQCAGYSATYRGGKKVYRETDRRSSQCHRQRHRTDLSFGRTRQRDPSPSP